MVLIPLFPKWGQAASQEDLVNRIQLLEIQIQQLKELREQQKLSVEKEQHCIKVVGTDKFCKCIAEKLPNDVGFEKYVHILVSTPEELRYESLKPEEKKLIDAVHASREKCVEKGFFR